MSPEALSGRRTDERADLWSLGVMRFEMLSGQHTFFGSNHGETVNDVLHRPLPELDAERLGSALIALLQRMLEREQPVASMRQVDAELEQITRELRAAGYERLGTTWGTCSRWMGWPAAPVPLVARSGRPGRAVELLALVDHHPATEPATRNRRVRPPRAEPGARFPPAELEAAQARGRALELAALRLDDEALA